MKIIEKYIDELMDYFPINKTTKTMRMDLLQSASKDYYQLVDNGYEEDEARKQIIAAIESPDKIAKMVPNRRTFMYYLLLFLLLVAYYFIYQYASRPNFLQVFWPTVLEFPDIIERCIHFIMVFSIAYIAFYCVIRSLPQKYLNRSFGQSCLLLYSGTILLALYLSISVAFVWFSFNGYGEAEMTSSLFIQFQYHFYRAFINSEFMTILYAIVNALCLVFSRQQYHITKVPSENYTLEAIYHPISIKVNEDFKELEGALIDQEETSHNLLTDSSYNTPVLAMEAAEIQTPDTKNNELVDTPDESEPNEDSSIKEEIIEDSQNESELDSEITDISNNEKTACIVKEKTVESIQDLEQTIQEANSSQNELESASESIEEGTVEPIDKDSDVLIGQSETEPVAVETPLTKTENAESLLQPTEILDKIKASSRKNSKKDTKKQKDSKKNQKKHKPVIKLARDVRKK